MASFNLKLAVGVIVILAVVILAGLVFYSTPPGIKYGAPTTLTVSGTQTPVLLTDPPIVPAGTTALVISYSSVKVHTSGASSSGWLNASGSGTINLLSLINTTEVIGTANISANSTINMISFNVTSAIITINGTTSNVTLPSHTVTAHIAGENKVNATSGLLLDLSPTVAAIYTANSTVFVMVPSVRAIVVGSRNISAPQSVGSRVALNTSDKKDLEDAKPNISIESSSMSVSGNSTDLSVAVKDNSNSSVIIRHILVFGNYSVVVASSTRANATVHVISDNGSISDSGNVSVGEGGSNSTDKGASIRANVTVNSNANVSVGRKLGDNANVPPVALNSSSASQDTSESDLVSEGIDAQHTRMFNFLVNQNGTLVLPSSSSEYGGQDSGYNLTAGSTAIFTFSGKLSFGEGQITIMPSSGSTYSLVVSGENGASASTNVTVK